VATLIAAIDQGRTLAGDHRRTDLTAKLDTARERLESRTITAVVVGEFKRGKSTLINALLQTAVCPVDADIVTAVPTLVRYGDRPGLTVYRQAGPDAEPVAEPAPLASITSVVSERPDPSGNGRIRSVMVRVPHRMLRSGLCLMDTPGVGGLDSVHGQLTVASLEQADAVLFVTDAAQELTAPELDFLRTAVERCPAAALVVTKTDLYPHWRRIAELDRGHLERAGLDLPVIAVSSFLRLRAVQQPELNDESGYAPLVQFLAGAVVVPATERVATTVAHDVGFVATQLAQEADAERVVLATPKESERVISDLSNARRRAADLSAATATWQQTLADGITDLIADVEHDLQERFRTVLRDAETIVDEGDPSETWPDIEVWLRRQVAVAGVANRDLMVTRARELSERVAEQFDLEAGTGVDLELGAAGSSLDSVELASASSLSMPGGRLGSLMVAGRSAVYVPMVLFGIASAVGVPLVAIAGVALGAGIGGKLIRDERKRQRVYRQQQAKAATRRFVDEVAFVMNKETRDSLRRAQRQLRDDFQFRAAVMQRSTSAALDAAGRAARLSPAEQTARAARLAAEAEQLRTIRSSVRDLAATGARVAAGAAAGTGIGLLADHAMHHDVPDDPAPGDGHD
jgi:GTPase SAR1 family protein